MTKPLTPAEAIHKKESEIPDFVIESFNRLIAGSINIHTGECTLSQDVIVHEIIGNSPHELNRQDIFDNEWLDIEQLFKKYGWNVVYDKPGYNESYTAKFIFTPIKGIK